MIDIREIVSFRYFEALATRLLPGLVSAAALLLVASRISIEQYGLFSLAVASSGFASILIFGPLNLGAVAQHAHVASRLGQGKYESSYIACLFIIAAALALAGLVTSFLNIASVAWISSVITFGLYSSCLELLRAKLRIWRFGIASLAQSVFYLLLVHLLLRDDSSADFALQLFAASYGVGFIVGLALIGFVTLRMPFRAAIVDTFRLGFGSVFSSAAEQGLYVGMRYIIFAFGSSQALGSFSFCVDLAQRTVGFLINAASFVFVPLAFKYDAAGNNAAFTQTLSKAVQSSLLLSIVTFFGVLCVWQSRLVPALSSSLFDSVLFGIVCIAVVINRVKKLGIDPYIFRANTPHLLSIGYLLGIPLAFVGGAISYFLDLTYLGASFYMIGYLAAAVVTLFVLKRKSATS